MDAKQCVVVLDTNVLHYVRLYLSYSEGKHRYPNRGVQWSKTEKQISETVKEKKIQDHCCPINFAENGLGTSRVV